jgi:hypothetical protein
MHTLANLMVAFPPMNVSMIAILHPAWIPGELISYDLYGFRRFVVNDATTGVVVYEIPDLGIPFAFSTNSGFLASVIIGQI